MRWGESQLCEVSDSPRLDIQLLIGLVLHTDRARIFTQLKDPIHQAQWMKLRDLVEKRKSGWNMAYLLGSKEFMGLPFKVDPRVLVPRPDTECLVEWALELLKSMPRELRILDLCTGSGAIAGAIKHFCPEARVGACDLSVPALELAKENWAALALLVDSWRSDLLTEVPGSWDMILTNPPYLTPAETDDCIETQRWKEPAMALNGFGPDGLDLIRKLVPQGHSALNPGGILLIEAAPPQMTAIKGIMEDQGFFYLGVRNDLEDRPRVIGGRKA